MTLEELYYADFEIMEPELVLQSWNDSYSYTGYQCSGRPYDGLMLITGDIRMEFSMIDGVTVTAAKNDLVYLPMGLRYTVRIEWEAAALPRIQDLLFNFILRDENGQALSLSDIPLIVSRDGERFEKYFQVLSAACAVMNDMATFDQAGIDDGYLDEIRQGDQFTVEGKA